MRTHERYGPGGRQPAHPTGGLLEITIDHEDGTGTRTRWTDDGTPVEVDQPVTLPTPTTPPPDPLTARIAALEADLAATKARLTTVEGRVR